MKRVLIATPSYDGKVGVQYTHSLLQTVQLGLANDVLFQPVYIAYDALVQRARNDLVAIAMDGDFDSVLWIDSDMEWNPEWALKFALSEHDVIGAPCPKKSLQEVYNVKCAPEDLVPDEDGLIKVLSVGTGFLKMSKKAIQHLWDNSPKYLSNEAERRWVFDVQIIDEDIYSEDTLVCTKLIEGGFDVLVDSTMTLNHVGPMTFGGNFADFVKRVQDSLAKEA